MLTWRCCPRLNETSSIIQQVEGTGCTMSGKQSGNIINMGLKIKFIISDPKKIIEEPNKDDIKWFIMMLLISVKN